MLVVAIAAGFSGITWKWLDAEDQRGKAEDAAGSERRAKLVAQQATARATAAFEKEQAESYLRGVVLADREWHADNVGRCLQLLRDCPKDLRRWEWGYLWRRCHLDLFPAARHGDAVTALAYSPDGRLLASASKDGTAKIWRAEDGRLVQTFTGHGKEVTCLAFHPEESDRIATGGKDGTVRVWNAATGKEVMPPLRVGGTVRTLAFRPDGSQLAVGGGRNLSERGGEISIWSVPGGKEVRRWRAHRNSLYRLVFTPDGSRLASAGADSTVRLWDTQSWEEARVLKEDAGSGEALAFDLDGRWLATSSLIGKIRLWDVRNAKRPPVTIGWHHYSVTGLAFRPDGARLATSGRDRVLKIWDWAALARAVLEGKYSDDLPFDETVTLRGHTAPVSAVAWDPDGRRLASGGEDGSVRVWDADREPGARVLARRPRATVEALAISPDGRRLAFADWALGKKGTDPVTYTVTVWDVDRGRPLKRLVGLPTFVRSLAFLDREGKRLAYGKDDHTIVVWEWEKGNKEPLRGHTLPVCALAVSPDGGRLASAGGVGGPAGLMGRDKPGEVLLWDLSDLRRPPVRLGGHGRAATALAFRPDGRWLASAGCDRVVRVWDVKAGREACPPLEHAGEVAGLAFSPVGTRLAAVPINQKVVVWEFSRAGAPPRREFVLQGHVAMMLAVAYSPDGRRLVTAAPHMGRGEVKIWDTATGLELFTLPGHKGFVNRALFSPDGRTLYSSGTDGTVRAWDGGPTAEEKKGPPASE
jgi:WD40 repeat protein